MVFINTEANAELVLSLVNAGKPDLIKLMQQDYIGSHSNRLNQIRLDQSSPLAEESVERQAAIQQIVITI